MKEQKEMKYMLLEIGRKGILIIKWKKKTLAELCSVVRWKAEFINNELGYLDEISK